MARRFSAPYQSEPVSSLATWARNLAVFSVVAVLVSIVIVRFGFLEMKPALATFFGALACAGLSILVGLRRLRRDLAERIARHEPHPAGVPDRRGRAGLSRPISACNTASCRRSTTSPPIRSIRRASRRWRGCAPATAPTPRSMPVSIPPNSSGWPIPISRPSNSRSRRSGPMRSRWRSSPSANGS